jgi:hypothetical protein
MDLVLLCHSKVWLFKDFTPDDFLSGKASELKLLIIFSQKKLFVLKDKFNTLD